MLNTFSFSDEELELIIDGVRAMSIAINLDCQENNRDVVSAKRYALSLKLIDMLVSSKNNA